MHALKWLGAFVILVALGLGGFSLAVAAATTPLTVPPTPAILTVESDRVELQKSGSEEWTVVTGELEVSVGDSVWTNTTGGATINLYDQGIIRLDADTTITIEQADFDPDHPEVFTGNIFVKTGQLWSRVFDFVSPDSSYNVYTPTTVATVRGTVFSVWERGGMSGVYVDEHTVNASSKGEETEVTTGEFLMIDPMAPKLLTKQTVDSDMAAWIAKNRNKDTKLDLEVLRKLKAHLRERGRFTEFAEKLRLAATLDPEAKAALRNRFELRAKLFARLQGIKNVDIPVETTVTTDEPIELPIDVLPGRTVTVPIVPKEVPVTPPTTVPTEPTPPVTPAPTPVLLTVSAKTTYVSAGSQTAITAILTYSDASQVNVSKDVNWDVLPDEQGYTAGRMVSNIFVAGDRGGTAVIQGIYTGATERFIKNISMTVTAPTAAAPQLY